MIPDKQSYRVRDVVTRRTIGNVDEAFVLELNGSGEEEDGRIRQFVMAGRTWTIVDADPEQSEVLVAPVSMQGAPTWVGELPCSSHCRKEHRSPSTINRRGFRTHRCARYRSNRCCRSVGTRRSSSDILSVGR